jgi:hypothetical protein
MVIACKKRGRNQSVQWALRSAFSEDGYQPALFFYTPLVLKNIVTKDDFNDQKYITKNINLNSHYKT